MSDKEEKEKQPEKKSVLAPDEKDITEQGDSNDEEELVKLIRLAVRQEIHFSGPLPHPDILKQYNDVIPGCAETFVDQFVAQSNHRRELERIVVEGDIKRANWGLAAGFALGLVGLLGSFYVISIGYSITGGGAFILALATLIGSFIYTVRKRDKEREEKRRLVPERIVDDHQVE